MKTMLEIEGKSQYDSDIEERFRPSACGPVTAYVILRHILPSGCPHNPNDLYNLLGGTKIGLFKWRFIHAMRKLLGKEWSVSTCGIEEMKQELLEGRPVAAKFDKWFRLRWRGQYEFNYHWVPVIGFEERGDETVLIIHDNGGRNRGSMIRQVSYKRNRPILSFVKITPVPKQIE